MKSERLLRSRAGYLLVAIALTLGILSPSLVPAMASAAQIDTRSVALTSSAAGATSVSYTVTFTAPANAAAYIVDFCNDSPIPGQACGAPTGFSTASVSTTTASTTVSSLAANTVKVVQAVTGGSPATVTLDALHNPSAATDATAGNGFYARIITYDTSGHAGSYAPTVLGTGATDTGGVAMAITNSVDVTAAVRETMTFCVSKSAPTANCTGTDTPNVVLGHGTPAALDSGARDTAGIYAQISTNAASGAVINMTNNNACGGLKRAGTAVCDIAPSNTANAITAGTALFGLNVGTAAAVGTGSGTITAGTNYGTSSQYGMTYTGANTGVTSAYGDTIFTTTGAPANNMNVPITFAASASNSTPAGLYTATMNMVATGTY